MKKLIFNVEFDTADGQNVSALFLDIYEAQKYVSIISKIAVNIKETVTCRSIGI